MPSATRNVSKSDLGFIFIAVGTLGILARPYVLDLRPRGDSPLWDGVALGLAVVPIVALIAGVIMLVLGTRARRARR